MKVKHDGRVVLSKPEYSRFRQRVYDYQNGKCYLCLRWTWPAWDGEMELHHEGERGLGGSRRNDVAWFTAHKWDGKMRYGLVYGLCQDCHMDQDKKRLFWSKAGSGANG